MSEQRPQPIVRRAEENEYFELDTADGVEKTIIFHEDDGVPNFRMRRYRLEPGATVPKHTNSVEHEAHAIQGEFVAGIGEEETLIEAGDSMFIPDGTVHWFRNDGDETAIFLCMVPIGDAEIDLIDDE
ncbi:MAG: cupin domain-containing protein [Halodesulfurarchaeum sp.]